MAGLTSKKVVKKAKKHGVKAGQKSLVRPSQKKSVKNGRYQERETPKVKIAKTKAAIPVGLDGPVIDETDDFDSCLQPEFDEGEVPFDETETDDEVYYDFVLGKEGDQ